MDSYFSVDITHAFIVGEDEIKKLTRLLNGRIGNVEYRINCSDNITRSFKSTAELFDFENSKTKTIDRLHIIARSDDYTKDASIDFSNSRWRGISIAIHARDDMVDKLKDEILDVISGMHPWYSFLHRVDFVTVSIFTYMALLVVLISIVAFGLVPTHESSNNDISKTASSWLILLGVSAVVFLLGLFLNHFRNCIFPRAIFLIGQNKIRFRQSDKFQWGCVIAFIVSFIAGAILLLLQLIVK